jgi:hypothetical protein
VNQLVPITLAALPAFVAAAGERASMPFLEFIIAMGNWMMFSLLFRNLRIPLAEGLIVWPPDEPSSRTIPFTSTAGIYLYPDGSHLTRRWSKPGWTIRFSS